MKKEKMSLEKVKNVLSDTLSREEMKQVMAGSGAVCGVCWDPVLGGGLCYVQSGGGGDCRCSVNGALC